jgi:hypothetical protein
LVWGGGRRGDGRQQVVKFALVELGVAEPGVVVDDRSSSSIGIGAKEEEQGKEGHLGEHVYQEFRFGLETALTCGHHAIVVAYG